MSTLDEGSSCPQVYMVGPEEYNCDGTMEWVPAGECSCHIRPPCPAHENAILTCNSCGYEYELEEL